jgi:hypothetical protein
MALLVAAAAPAQVSVSIGLPHVSIGINVPVYPDLEPVPGEPVYYAPRVDTNYFFYDGLYWVFQGDDWFASTWYNGPWRRVDRYSVPPPVLRVPVRYYRRPPAYFQPWRRDDPPRWGNRWGRDWEQRRHGWNERDMHAAPAPLPEYQRNYAGPHYPRGPQQQELHSQNYHYQPQDPVARDRYRQDEQRRQPPPEQRGPGPKDSRQNGSKHRGPYPYPPPHP